MWPLQLRQAMGQPAWEDNRDPAGKGALDTTRMPLSFIYHSDRVMFLIETTRKQCLLRILSSSSDEKTICSFELKRDEQPSPTH